MKAKGVMVIGLDGATWKMLDYGMDKGKLSLFSDLKKKGCSGTLMSTIPATTSPALPSLYTGKNPGRHGIFGFVKHDDSLVSIRDIKGKKLWNYMDDAGVRAFLFELMITYPPEQINGVMVSSDRDRPGKDIDFVHPSELKRELEGVSILQEFDHLTELRRDPDNNKDRILEFHLKYLRKKFAALKKIAKSNPFDFSIYWIAEIDSVQHYCWAYPDTVLRIYKETEHVISELKDAMPGWDFIIMSDHGFGPTPRTNFHVNTWLESAGYLTVSGGMLSGLIKRAHFIIGSLMDRHSFLRKVVKRLVNPASSKGGESSARKSSTIFAHRVPGLDLGNTKAYLQHKWGISIIRENVGDKEYEPLRERIIAEMKNLRNENGTLVVKNAWKREEIFKGGYVEVIPDIVFQANDNFEPEYHLGPSFLSKRPLERITGVHDTHREGIFIAFGPDFKSNHHSRNLSIIDIAPTLLYMYGIPVPKDMDGKVLKDILRPGFKPRPVRRGEKTKSEKGKILDAVKRIRI